MHHMFLVFKLKLNVDFLFFSFFLTAEENLIIREKKKSKPEFKPHFDLSVNC